MLTSCSNGDVMPRPKSQRYTGVLPLIHGAPCASGLGTRSANASHTFCRYAIRKNRDTTGACNGRHRWHHRYQCITNDPGDPARMINLPAGTRIWIVAGITDMRNGFNGLASKVQMPLKDDPLSGHVFIFRGRNGSQVKLLWSTGDGLCLLTKRLEGGRFAWPSARDGKVFLTHAQLAMLLEGIDWRHPKRLANSLTML